MPADTPAMAQFSALLLEFEFAVQNEMRAEERDAPFDRLARASDKVDAARAALLAAVERGEAETRDAERWRYARDHSAWHRYVDDDGVEQTYIMVRTLRGADLSCPAMRDYAIDALADAARAHPPIQETDNAEN